MIVTCFLNIILDIVFICRFGMGVEGVAYATVISQVVSTVLVLVVLRRNKNIKIDKHFFGAKIR